MPDADVPPPLVHDWFGLSYAQYLTVPRSVLQSMPEEWQVRFVTLLRELDRKIDWTPEEGWYWVCLKDERGRPIDDPLADYERGRRRIPFHLAGGSTCIVAGCDQSAEAACCACGDPVCHAHLYRGTWCDGEPRDWCLDCVEPAENPQH